LRGSVTATDYVNVVLGLLFLRFANDKFKIQRQRLLANEDTKDFVDNPRFYSRDNVFYLEEHDRWGYIKDKHRCTRGYKRYKETSGLIEWKRGHIFHSIFT